MAWNDPALEAQYDAAIAARDAACDACDAEHAPRVAAVTEGDMTTANECRDNQRALMATVIAEQQTALDAALADTSNDAEMADLRTVELARMRRFKLVARAIG